MQPVRRVDLSTGKVDQFSIPEKWQRDYLGGASLAARLLFEHLLPELDPLSAEAPLLFLNGPLSGTAGPAVGRFVICGKSPATHLWAESNCGGFWGPELRKTGFDGLWITGRAEHPVYLWIQGDEVQIRPANHLWGRDTYDTQQAIATELGISGVSIATIGPGGEAHIPYALILADHGRVAGRTGMGAVMGSKNLKAVAVKGTQKPMVFDPVRYAEIRGEANRTLREDAFSVVLRELGTSGGADYFDYLGMLPKRYFGKMGFNGAEDVTGTKLTEDFLVGVSACHACVIACGRVVKLPGKNEQGMTELRHGKKQKGPEYETMIGFGPNLWINDLGFITQMGDLCDRYGIDSISTSNVIGLAFRLYELGLISKQDTGGIALQWGDKQAVEILLNLMIKQEGFGILLGEGARALAKRFGAEEEAVQVNGLEAPYHDPRGASGMALVYATSPRGACHNQSDYFLVEVGQVEPAIGLKKFSFREGARKAVNVARHQDWRTVFNSLVMCLFSNVGPDIVLNLINSACGLEWSVEEMLRSGERGFTLKRLINHRLGLTRADDTLPKRMLESYSDDPEQFVPDFQTMLTAYYQARGWNPETGFPSEAKLNELGLGWVLGS